MRVRSLAPPALAVLVLAPFADAASSKSTSAAVQLAAEDDPDDPTGKTLYVTEPACGYYKCVVTWPVGSHVAVNWLGPPPGNVSVSLVSNVGGPSYTIVSNVPATSQEGYCDSGYGLGVLAPGHECGRVEFVVPEDWKQMDNYTIAVQSLSDSSLAGYTDAITIAPYNATAPSEVSSDDMPSGTKASIVAVAAPTTTDLSASTKYTGDIPAPTAGSDAIAASTSSSTLASSSRSSSVLSSSVRISSTSKTKASTSATSSTSDTVLLSSSSLVSSSGSSASAASAAAASASQTGAAPSSRPALARAAAALGATAIAFALLA